MAIAMSKMPIENNPTSERRLERAIYEKAISILKTVGLLFQRPLHSQEPWHRENNEHHVSQDIKRNKYAQLNEGMGTGPYNSSQIDPLRCGNFE